MPMEIEEIKKSTVQKLRQVKKDRDLTISNIMDMLESKSKYLSEGTVKRLFSDSSDPTSFKYRDTIAPLADVLLDLYSDKSGSDDVGALKALIHDKNKTISILIARDEERKADFERRISHLQKQINKLEEHLDFRERIIERKDAVIEKLITREDKVMDALISKINK